MPYAKLNGTLELPFSGRSPRARHNSYKAALSQASTRGSKKLRVFAFIRQHGLVTDQGIEEGCQIPINSVCSIRNALMSEGLIEEAGDTIGRYGRTVTVWKIRGASVALPAAPAGTAPTADELADVDGLEVA